MDSIFEALKNTTWQFIVTSVLTIVVAAAGIFIQWLLARSRKEMSYKILTNTAVVNVREEYQGRVEIRFHGRTVRNVRLLIFKLINSGHKAIAPDDYVEPVAIRFSGDSRILSATVAQTEPPAIRQLYAAVIANSQGSQIEFPRQLLNGGDWLTINILVSDYQGPLTVTGRIVDVKEIKESKDFTGRKKLTAYAIFFSAGVILSLLLPRPYDAIPIWVVLVAAARLWIIRDRNKGWMTPFQD